MKDKNMNNKKELDTTKKPESDDSSKIEKQIHIADKPNFFIGLLDVIKSIFK